MSYRDLSISKKITIPAILIFIVGLLIVIVNMRQLRSNTLELVGVKTAESVANEIIAVRGFYTKEIVKKGKNNNMKFRTDFAEHSDVFPLPATLVNSLGKSIAEQFPGMSIKLYSNYPFSHKERPVLDDFQKESLAALESKPDIPVWSIGMFNNRYSIRYVVPDIMKPGCVGCHNSHPNSIKRDWKAGDVRGAVEVVVPLDNVNSVLFTGFAKVFIIVVVIFAALVAVILYLIRKYVTVQVSVLSHNINAVADGNLNIQGAVTSTDEIGQVAAVFNKMTYMFRDVVNEIHSTSEQLDRSSNELTTSSNSIAEGTKEQSARASQVSTAAQEMSATLGEVVNNISGASDAARDASTAAIKGGDMVMSTVDSMNGIAATAKESSLIITALGSKSDEIGSIINVINDIADQTNLLALNAAIEAARAGEQGRGFAVVADEVRKLAEKTMTATKEIGKMIQGMQVETGKAIASVEHEVNAVDAGVKLASEAGEAISDIVAKVEEVTGMIEQISVASAEQSTVTEQISSDIDSVATVANETASNTVHISEASQDIARLAAGLKSKVEKFRIGKS